MRKNPDSFLFWESYFPFPSLTDTGRETDFARTLLDISLMDIGRYFSRDHSTVMSSIKKVEKESAVNQELSRVIYDIRKKIISK